MRKPTKESVMDNPLDSELLMLSNNPDSIPVHFKKRKYPEDDEGTHSAATVKKT